MPTVDFDPDAYLASKRPAPAPEPDFDPDAFIAQRSLSVIGEPPSTPVAQQSPAPASELGAASGLLPQLLNPISEDEAKLYISRGWAVQEKFDGNRFMIRKTGDKVVGINKLGKIKEISSSLVAKALTVDGDFTIDGEWISTANRYVAYDILGRRGDDLRGKPYSARYAELQSLGGFEVAEMVTGKEAAEAFIARLKAEGKEGFVLKDPTSRYTVGRPSEGGAQLKVKFWESASVIVKSIHPTKRSVGMALDGDRFVGNMTIPPNYPMPKVGDVVEVKYLYYVNNLVQPQYLGVRDDVLPSECTFRQQRIKTKGQARPAESLAKSLLDS